MSLTNEYIEAVSSNKKTRVRIMLKDIMLVDPTMKSFEEMLSYAEKNMESLYDVHDGEVLNESESAWTEDYMNQQMVSVVTNFSKERISLLKNIVRYLYGSKIKTDTSANIKHTKANASTHGNGFTGQQIAGGVIAIVGAGALLGGIIGSNIPVAIVGGVAIAGGAILIATGGKEV